MYNSKLLFFQSTKIAITRTQININSINIAINVNSNLDVVNGSSDAVNDNLDRINGNLGDTTKEQISVIISILLFSGKKISFFLLNVIYVLDQRSKNINLCAHRLF